MQESLPKGQWTKVKIGIKITKYTINPQKPSVPTTYKGSIWNTSNSFSSETKRIPLVKSEAISKIIPIATVEAGH